MSSFTVIPTEDNLSWIIPFLPLTEEEKAMNVDVSLVPFGNSGGLSGASMKSLQVRICEDQTNAKPAKTMKFVYKTAPKEHLPTSIRLGLPREALFYSSFAATLTKTLHIRIPKVFFSYGKMETGEKTIVLEDISGEGCITSFFFGSGSPVNWNKDLNALTSIVEVKPSLEEILSSTFIQAARLHRQYWMDSSLLNGSSDFSWLRSSGWISGRNRESWETSQNMAISYWKATKEKIVNGENKIEFDSFFLECMNHSIEQISWEKYQEVDLKQRKWTLVHGDFHPGNHFWLNPSKQEQEEGKDSKGSVAFLDWELVGFGSGPQELGQYVISHVDPSERKQLEDVVLRQYYNELTKKDGCEEGEVCRAVDSGSYSYEECYHDYVYGGLERWIWFFAVSPSFGNDKMIQYFHNQIASFIHDHGVTLEKLGMPRV
jgi:hypothetical protein